MIYEAVIGTGTIIFLLLVWTLLMHPFSEIKARIYNATPSSVFNESVNKTVIKSNLDLAENVFYYSPFFLIFIIFIWMIKVANEQQRGIYPET